MVFVNERLTSDQKEKFRLLKLKYPLNGEDFIPSWWTTDRLTGAFLVDGGRYHDIDDEQMFIFSDGKQTMLVTMKEIPLSRHKYVWRLKSLKCLNGADVANPSDLIPALQAALTAYGYDGLPSEYANCNADQTVVELDFEGFIL
jgi:hypothetical protein